MGYVKNEWNTGDVVTAAKLNNIEDGIDKAIEKPDTGNVNDVLTKTENGVKWAPASGGVESVNGKTGTVVLNSNDINDGDDTIHNVLGGKADLVSGKVPASQLPSYVDDVLEYNNLAAFPQTGETGKIYVAIDTNFTYRWSGSSYIKIGSGAEKFVVTFSEERWSSEYECYLVDSDKSIKEIYQAYSQGKIVEGIQDFGSYKYIYQLEMCGHESGEYSIGFVTNYEYSGRKNMFCFGCNDENNKEFLYVGISSLELPHHDIEDVGKVLTVNYNGGDVEWKTPSGGGSIPDAIITCYDNGSGGTWTVSCNKTYNELKTIIQNHGRIQMQHRHVYEANAYFIDDVSYCIMDNSDIIFQAVTPDAPSYTGKLLRYMIKVTSENVWTWDFSRFINTPTYNSSDANKVLKVNNNATEVEWGNAGGGDEKFICNISIDEVEHVTCDKTLEQIYDAYSNNKIVEGLVVDIAIAHLDYCDSSDGISVSFSGEIYGERFSISGGEGREDGDHWSWVAYKLVPYPDEEDGGKVLTVSSDTGGLNWSNIPTELPTYTSTDANKVLAVNAEGTGIGWNPAGGAEKFICNITHNKTNLGETISITCDKTTEEMYEAYSAGKIVEANITKINDGTIINGGTIGFLSWLRLDEVYNRYVVTFKSGVENYTYRAYEQEWIYDHDNLVPSGGTTNQVLTKTSSGYGWADASSSGTGLPTAPTSNGTYFLKCVIVDGTPTLSWDTLPTYNEGVS